MITCPFCQAINLDDANFCSNCGKPLPENVNPESTSSAADILATEAADIDRETDPVADDVMAAITQQETETTILKPVPQPAQQPVAIRLKIGHKKREMVLPLDQTIHIGRQDPTLDLFPEVDVSNDGPEAKSVSRRHARISSQDDLIIIVDEGSSNGTFVNGKKLQAFKYKVLQTGDVFQLGKLRFGVEILTGQSDV